MTQAAAEPDLRCYHHPGRKAEGQCDRCGDYLCAECIKTRNEQPLCPGCYRKTEPVVIGRFDKIMAVLNFASMFMAGFAMPIAGVAGLFLRAPVGEERTRPAARLRAAIKLNSIGYLAFIPVCAALWAFNHYADSAPLSRLMLTVSFVAVGTVTAVPFGWSFWRCLQASKAGAEPRWVRGLTLAVAGFGAGIGIVLMMVPVMMAIAL